MSRERAPSTTMAPRTNGTKIRANQKYEDFTTIDWIQDAILHSAYIGHGSRWEVAWAWTWSKSSIFADAAQSWFVVSLVGECLHWGQCCLISIITAWLSDLKMGYCHDGWWLNRQFCCWEIENDDAGCDSWHRWSTVLPVRWTIYVIFAGTFCFTAAHLVRSIAKYAAGSGISEIKCILGGFIMKGYLGFGTFFIKSMTLPLVIASGLSVGKEGPSVHVACCIGYLVASLFKRYHLSQGKMREILTASSAAGVAVAFGSPIGGVLFSIEVVTLSVSHYWQFESVAQCTSAPQAMNPYRSGKLVLFQVTYDRDWHFFEVMFFVILGIFGVMAAFRRKHLGSFPVSEAVILATITAMVGYFNRFVRIDMTESMSISSGDYDNICQTSEQWPMVNSLFLATILRIGLVVISYGCKVPAAFPESSMFAVCQHDVQCITPGTYAFLGAAAALSGVMRLTVTVVVIMFELTGALTYILPTMIVLLVTKAVGDFLGTTGIADEMIRFNGYPFLERDDEAYDVPVSRVMKTQLHTIPASGICIRDVEERLKTTDVKGFPVVSADGNHILLGYIDRVELVYVLDRARRVQNISSTTPCSFASDQDDHIQIEFQVDFPGMATGPALGIDEDISMEILETTATPGVLKFWPWVNQTPFTVSPQLPLEIAMQMFKRMGPRVILVEDRGELIGLVTVKDVLRFTLTEHSRTQSPWSEAEFEGIIEEAWAWTTDRFYAFLSYCRALVRR
ncbi:chloride channel [Fomitopsis serialis]|uniref:chloride channel n=1 Tax=Fomitopsis serialis TaxID=139415 RepID=UPI002008A45B|nr:chloride channel [Neoantrodia serialis]KAH9920115.1 chloride channel [Neoantrodia serialis]